MSAYQSFMTVLGWSLTDSFWQMAVLWLIYYLLTAGNNRISSAGKHNLILVFVFIGAEWFVYTLFHLMNEPVKPFGFGFIPISSSANTWIYFFSLIYLGILIFRSLQYLFRSRFFRLGKIEKTFPPDLQFFTDRNSRILGISRRVNVYLSNLAETAQTSGFLKPIILLPVSLVTRLSSQQIEAILIHELFHIRRNDYLINICMSCFRWIFFFNPFAHLFYRALERERELACDDAVVEKGFSPDQYAEALFCLEKFRQVHPGFQLAANGNKPWLLMERICRLLGKPSLNRNPFSPLIILSLFISILLFGLRLTIPEVNNETGQYSNTKASVVPIKYNTAKKNIVQLVKAVAFRRSVPWRSEKLRKIKVTAPASPLDQIESARLALPIKTYFADDKILRNFSNQQMALGNQADIVASANSPFLPSETLSYQAVPEINWQDSIRDVVIQNNYNDLKSQNRIKAIANLQVLESEIEKNSEQLKRIEKENRNLIILNSRNVKSLLDSIQMQIKLKKHRIDQLQARLEISEEEIIHI